MQETALPAASPEALNDRGVSLARQGRHAAAIDCYAAALRQRPDYALALNNLGLALQERGRLDAALDAHRRAVAAAPGLAEAHEGCAAVLAALGRPEEAIAAYRRALALAPDRVEALANLGDLLRRADALEEALALQRRAASLRPDHAQLWNLLGLTLQECGDAAAAITCFRRAVALAPGFAGAHLNLAMALLAAGDIAAGAAEYEWRWGGGNAALRPRIAAPLWDGKPLGQGTLLLWAEQGFGDTIQFIRYAPLLRPYAGRILLACPPPLAALMQSAAGLDAVLGFDAALPPVTAHLPVVSAMHRLGTGRDDIPAAVPYLAAEPARRARLARLLQGAGRRLGLVWSGNPRHENDRRRSLAPELLAPLLDLPGWRCVSLQLGPRAGALAPAGGRVVDLAPYLGDFADTAAAIAELDCVVTVDTAAAHLAGALGKPCLVLLPYVADWRWLAARGDSPWYPSLRLLRQAEPGAWPPVIAEARRLLAASAPAAPPSAATPEPGDRQLFPADPRTETARKLTAP